MGPCGARGGGARLCRGRGAEARPGGAAGARGADWQHRFARDFRGDAGPGPRGNPQPSRRCGNRLAGCLLDHAAALCSRPRHRVLQCSMADGGARMDTNTSTSKPGSNAPRESVTVTDNSSGKSIELPMKSGTIGPKVIDIRRLYPGLDHFTFDPGYTATGSCESKITYIDGDAGVLLYRGYPIEELASHSDFMEVSYLLLNG